MSTKAKFTVYEHTGCMCGLQCVFSALAHATLSVYCFICQSFTDHPFWRSFLSLCLCGFSHSASQLLSAFPLAFPHFSIYLSHLFLLNTLALVHLCPCPSFLSFPLFYLPFPFLTPVGLHPYSTSSLTNEATGWLQVVVHQGHDSSWPSQSNDTKALSTVPLYPRPFSLQSVL